jgi:hypothetical protein
VLGQPWVSTTLCFSLGADALAPDALAWMQVHVHAVHGDDELR